MMFQNDKRISIIGQNYQMNTERTKWSLPGDAKGVFKQVRMRGIRLNGECLDKVWKSYVESYCFLTQIKIWEVEQQSA